MRLNLGLLLLMLGKHGTQQQSHRTQVAGSPFDQLTAAEAEALLEVEHYRRADVGSAGPAFIERLASPRENA